MKSSKNHGPGKIALKIIASSLNPQPSPSPVRIFNAHKLDFLNANFDGPEGYCFAALAACNIMVSDIVSKLLKPSEARRVVIAISCHFDFQRAWPARLPAAAPVFG